MRPRESIYYHLWRFYAASFLRRGSASQEEIRVLCEIEEQIANDCGICLAVGTCRQ